MHGLRKMLARFVLLVAALTVIPVALAPSAPDRSPYVSALADLTVGSALAQTTCTYTVCNRGGTKCNPVTRLQSCVLVHGKNGSCTNVAC
jgi:hypothetical protein